MIAQCRKDFHPQACLTKRSAFAFVPSLLRCIDLTSFSCSLGTLLRKDRQHRADGFARQLSDYEAGSFKHEECSAGAVETSSSSKPRRWL